MTMTQCDNETIWEWYTMVKSLPQVVNIGCVMIPECLLEKYSCVSPCFLSHGTWFCIRWINKLLWDLLQAFLLLVVHLMLSAVYPRVVNLLSRICNVVLKKKHFQLYSLLIYKGFPHHNWEKLFCWKEFREGWWWRSDMKDVLVTGPSGP